jgi:choline dehydrogenase-like flavoprotein
MGFDVIAIGSGQAGAPLTTRLARAGTSVLLAERGELGGTCVNTGRTPTKTPVASARAAHVARLGVHAKAAHKEKNMSLKHSFVASLLGASALWVAPALAEDSYRTVPPDAKEAARPTTDSARRHASTTAAEPGVGGSGTGECLHQEAELAGCVDSGQPHGRRMQPRAPVDGHSAQPTNSREPLRH